jgi:hypothetical protein
MTNDVFIICVLFVDVFFYSEEFVPLKKLKRDVYIQSVIASTM